MIVSVSAMPPSMQKSLRLPWNHIQMTFQKNMT